MQPSESQLSAVCSQTDGLQTSSQLFRGQLCSLPRFRLNPPVWGSFKRAVKRATRLAGLDLLLTRAKQDHAVLEPVLVRSHAASVHLIQSPRGPARVPVDRWASVGQMQPRPYPPLFHLHETKRLDESFHLLPLNKHPVDRVIDVQIRLLRPRRGLHVSHDADEPIDQESESLRRHRTKHVPNLNTNLEHVCGETRILCCCFFFFFVVTVFTRGACVSGPWWSVSLPS